ncbi:MAG: hypothetical protein RJA63_2642, partial [Pseudomonadota bacterium]
YAGKPTSKDGQDGSGWLYAHHAMSFPLKKKRNSSQEADMYLGYQISLLADSLLPDDKFPMVHVFLWSVLNDLEDYRVRFPFDDGKLEADRLITWANGDASKWTDRDWTFSLRLTSLNNRQNLVESVINPALALLQMKTAIEALPDDLPGLVFYPQSVVPEVSVLA